MTTRRFDFAFDPRYRLAGLPFGVLPATTWVEVGDGRLRARFSWWRLDTPLTNVAGVERSGGYAFVKTAGPPHLSLTDRGVTFATNGEQGVCVSFHEPVPAIDPTGTIRHPGATFTVADPDGFVAALTSA
ncbi:hypothetical protein [Arthrobacter sp. NEB 688]|uniref:hypothetical protein n=1 Tax=Arthrobacter sp. NEB 688 TaxID=904039 RepID=UPI001567284D|nr:hypothetical protein [Arthrobacter sp. NEB 688]QKE85645.1 hypothetical protein HL663_18105 [Arthrobacter sp. NEB 688]